MNFHVCSLVYTCANNSISHIRLHKCLFSVIIASSTTVIGAFVKLIGITIHIIKIYSGITSGIVLLVDDFVHRDSRS